MKNRGLLIAVTVAAVGLLGLAGLTYVQSEGSSCKMHSDAAKSVSSGSQGGEHGQCAMHASAPCKPDCKGCPGLTGGKCASSANCICYKDMTKCTCGKDCKCDATKNCGCISKMSCTGKAGCADKMGCVGKTGCPGMQQGKSCGAGSCTGQKSTI